MVSSKAYPRLVVQAFSGSLAPTMLLDVCFQPWLRSTPGGVFREAVPHGEVERYYLSYIVGFICGTYCNISCKSCHVVNYVIMCEPEMVFRMWLIDFRVTHSHKPRNSRSRDVIVFNRKFGHFSSQSGSVRVNCGFLCNL